MKRIVQIILIALTILMLMACRTTHKAVQEEAHIKVEQTDSTQEDSAGSESWTEERNATISETEHGFVRITELSEPDSAGWQYPTRVTEIDYSRQRGTDIKEKEQTDTQSMASRQSLKKGRAGGGQKKETEVTRRRTFPWWLFIVVVSVGMALVIYYNRKR